MAHKKLKLEVELDTAKAKSQVKGLAAEGGAGVATATPKSADALAQSLDRASKSVSDFGDKSKASSQQIAGVVRSFAGLGVGMAMSYAARNMERGTARTAVETAGGAVQGASMASAALMAIPGAAQLKALGMVAGAAIGGGKVLFDKKGERDAYSKDFEKSEREYADSRDWADHFKSLTGVGETDMNADELAATVEKITAAIGQLNHEEKERVTTIKEAIRAGELDAAAREREELATTRAKRAQLEAVRDNYNRQIEKEEKEKKDTFRESTSGTDSLQKIGLDGADATDVTKASDAESAAPADATPPSRHPTPQSNAPADATPPSRRFASGGFGFSVPTKSYQEIKFGNFENSDPTEKVIDEQIKRIDQDQLEILKAIDRHIQDTNGGTSWQ